MIANQNVWLIDLQILGILQLDIDSKYLEQPSQQHGHNAERVSERENSKNSAHK